MKFFGFFRQQRQIRELIQKNKELISLNEYLRERNRQLSENNAFNNKLLSFIAHDFREPVSNIAWLCSMYGSDQLPADEFPAFMKELQDVTGNTLNGFDHALQWVKSKWDGFEMQPEPVIPYALLKDIAAGFKNWLEKKDLRLTVQGAQDVSLQADPQLMRFVLKNLLSNAIKFSYPGGAIIAEVREKEAGHLHILVKDSGTGMDAVTLKRLFTHEQRVHNGTRGEKGAGIALVICKDFIERQQGTIRVSSAPEQGTAFIIEIKRFTHAS